MEITPESIREQIPYYLTQDQKDGLTKALRDFPADTNYYLHAYENELLQGDGWTKLQVRSFDTGEKKSILGIILSNTCDVAPENKRDFPAKIAFAPIIPLSAYVTLLYRSGINQDQVQNKVSSIREQRVTNIFFLPAGSGLQEDHIALLDDLHTMPAKIFELETEKSKSFTLSLIGFYLFVLKLSVHFCRFHDKVPRV
jgi:hypothetical protein